MAASSSQTFCGFLKKWERSNISMEKIMSEDAEQVWKTPLIPSTTSGLLKARSS